MNVSTSFTHPHVPPDPHDALSSVEHKIHVAQCPSKKRHWLHQSWSRTENSSVDYILKPWGTRRNLSVTISQHVIVNIYRTNELWAKGHFWLNNSDFRFWMNSWLFLIRHNDSNRLRIGSLKHLFRIFADSLMTPSAGYVVTTAVARCSIDWLILFRADRVDSIHIGRTQGFNGVLSSHPKNVG